MKVGQIYSNNFMAAKKLTKINKLSKPVKKTTKDEFYRNIESFLKKDIDKMEYLKLFSDIVNKIRKEKSYMNFTEAEKNYINDILMTMDLTANLDKISNSYITKNMLSLLKAKK